ncbi:hypothetical protein ODZ84_20870 [Chryseobacterium fluminis]|uniref:hypothetical protein n=1 Tax=Chryseobacterium fluminis TaxID=2983606 RepID=UPI00225B1F61|nr:hypothetical protein [Chryseobacterium sp. MMS21-Ot14]UZT97599.1 hypothetical protein ODZ84_20870 [Chryseobacterium sp. MMS21-Ot14]
MKKIYYFPGLASALVIPVLFWYYINPYVDITKYNIMDMGLPAKLERGAVHSIYSFEPYRNWDYMKIKVVPAKAKENSAFYVSELKKLNQRNEKNTGIEFILDNNNTYGDLASLLNDMAIARHETYGLDIGETGHLFAGVNYIDPNAREEEFKCLLCNDTIVYEDTSVRASVLDFIRRDSYRTFFENISKLPKAAYYIVFGFLLFVNMSMLSIKERFAL